jgi:hypothetical protein
MPSGRKVISEADLRRNPARTRQTEAQQIVPTTEIGERMRPLLKLLPRWLSVAAFFAAFFCVHLRLPASPWI